MTLPSTRTQATPILALGILMAGILIVGTPGTGTSAPPREEPLMKEGHARPAQRIDSSGAVQGIAVDGQQVYTIANCSIGKYDKYSGEPSSPGRRKRAIGISLISIAV